MRSRPPSELVEVVLAYPEQALRLIVFKSKEHRWHCRMPDLIVPSGDGMMRELEVHGYATASEAVRTAVRAWLGALMTEDE